MAIKITPDEFDLLIQRLSKMARVCPVLEVSRRTFSDTDSIIYQQLAAETSHLAREIAHVAEYHYRPYHRNALFISIKGIQIAGQTHLPIIIFARACVYCSAMSRLDYMYLSNGDNSDYSYQLLRGIFVSSLLSVKKASKIVSASQWVPIKERLL